MCIKNPLEGTSGISTWRPATISLALFYAHCGGVVGEKVKSKFGDVLQRVLSARMRIFNLI